ncbi:MAG TPA: acyl-CoA dehydrogenase family protein [Acidimicrobiia bacterium]|jgi:alkylation response protein AidB-like acyl-CoA dehydrogenase
MNLELDEDQEFFRETTRKFLATEAPLTKVRALYEDVDGFDRSWWRSAADLGWTSMFVPEALGGGSLSGHPTVDAVIVAEEMGRSVSPGPYLPVNVVAAALAWSGSEPQQEAVLPGLLAGDAFATWALCEPGGRWEPEHVTTTARIDGDAVVLDGTKAYVEAAGVASHVLVTARGDGGLSQVLVPVDADGVTVRRGRSIDMTRRFGAIGLDGVRLPVSAVVGEPGGAGREVRRQLALAIALLCAEMVGAADRTLEFTLEYGADRFAFGRPIVSFQVLKHRIADMVVWLEGSKAVSDELARALDDGRDDIEVLAGVAKAYVGEHAPDIVDDCVQITGGIGVTWEHDLHLYNRRAAVDRAVYGTPEEHKERLFARLEEMSR